MFRNAFGNAGSEISGNCIREVVISNTGSMGYMFSESLALQPSSQTIDIYKP